MWRLGVSGDLGVGLRVWLMDRGKVLRDSLPRTGMERHSVVRSTVDGQTLHNLA